MRESYPVPVSVAAGTLKKQHVKLQWMGFWLSKRLRMGWEWWRACAYRERYRLLSGVLQYYGAEKHIVGLIEPYNLDLALICSSSGALASLMLVVKAGLGS